VNPRLLHAHLDFYAALRAPSALSKLRKELIATAVSADNGCRHCTQLHGGFLGKLTTDEGLVHALMTDPASAPLHGADRALITYALKLTRTPREVCESDVAALRAAGFDCRVRDDELAMLWDKLAFLAPLALATTALDAPYGDVRADPRYRGCQDEVLAVARAEGAAVDETALHALEEAAVDHRDAEK
jgi:uncharacterized peroxidase-related enzyme